MHPFRPALERPAGFTLVEMMASIAAASILALTFGVLIASSFSAMKRNRERVDDQRDVTAALQVIDHLVRPASRYGISVSSGRVDVVRGASTGSVFVSGRDLILDPDTVVVGDAVRVLKGSVGSFRPVLSNRVLRLHLQVAGLADTTTVSSAIALRNSP